MKKLIILTILLFSTTLVLNWCSKKMEITEWDKVTVSYDSFSQDWKIIEQKQETTFVIWLQQTFPAFEKELIWMKKWETKEFTATAEDGYAIKHENNKIQEINPTIFSNIGTNPTVWETISLGNMKWLVLDVSTTAVKIDFNEEYTREPATFNVKILEIERN